MLPRQMVLNTLHHQRAAVTRDQSTNFIHAKPPSSQYTVIQRTSGIVADKNMMRNTLVVVQGHDHPLLFNPRLSAADLTWVSEQEPHCNWVYAAKIRYRQSDAPCLITHLGGDRCDIEFAQPQWAVTPGQSVVVYESKVCLGGGIILG